MPDKTTVALPELPVNCWEWRLDRVVLTLGYPPAADTERRMVLPWRGYVEQTITHPFFGSSPVDVFAIRVADEGISNG